MRLIMNVRILILMLIYLEQSEAAVTLSTFPNTAVQGESFSFICLYADQPFITFTNGNTDICTIVGFKGDATCMISGSYNTSFAYKCDSITYTVTIPGIFLNEKLHLTKWECSSLDNSEKSGKKELYVNVPITMVTLSNSPKDENPVKVIKGREKTFTCRTDAGRPSSSIQWYLSDANITSAAIVPPNTCVTDCSGGKEISVSQIVYMGKTTDSGKNIYCTATNIDGRGVTSINKTLDVLYSPTTPSITQIPKGSVNENKTITLVCEIKGGNPLANITWQCNGSVPIESIGIPVNNGVSISRIELKATREKNEKVCYCIGSHPAWTTTNSTSIVLDISYTPLMPSITQIPIGPIIEGKKVELICEISGGNPLANISWICDGFTVTKQTIDFYTDKVVSRIELEVTKANDGKKCICRGEHPLWEDHKEKTTTVTVYFQPDNSPKITQTPTGSVDEGSIIVLRCEVPGGKPLAGITWQCNGSLEVPPTVTPPNDISVSLIQLNVTKQQHGENCTCIGSHPTWIQNKSSSKQLEVRYPPELFPNITQTKNGPIIEEHKVILTCEISGGNPLATIAWHCDGFTPVASTLLDNKVVSSIEKNVNRDDNGRNCSCSGHHRLWTPDTQTRSHTLQVYYSSTIHISNTKPFTLVENETKVLVCTEEDGNPRNASFLWFKSNRKVGSQSNYAINVANATHAGMYTCQGSNGFGRTSEAHIEVVVLYAPKMSAISALNGSIIPENGTAVLQCNVQSNPPPNMVWLKNGSNALSYSNGNLFQRNLHIENANCLDTSNYTCKAVNTIKNANYTTAKDIELFVKCSPRRYDRQEGSPNLIGLAVGQNLSISAHILAYPIFDISWIFGQDENSSTTIIQSAYNCSVYNIFEHNICFSRLNLTENDFGLYSAVIFNEIGNTTLSFQVNPQGKPYKSTNVKITCGILKAEITWKTAYNGGQQQKFYIITTNKDGSQQIYSTGKVGNEKEVKKVYTLAMPAGPFRFDVFGNNTFGNATVKGTSCLVQDLTETDSSVIGLAAGLGSGMAAVLLIIVAMIIVCRKRILKKHDDDANLFKRSENETSEKADDDLKDNPLYVTSATISDGENAAVYSTVDKAKAKGCDQTAFRLGLQGPVYSEVKKSEKKALPKDKKDKSKKKMQINGKKENHSEDIEMGNVYGNAQMILQDQIEEDVYANAENNSDSKNNIDKVYMPKKNKDGLIYADLELESGSSGKKFVIRGLENRTNYAIIDLNVKVDPLPSDDDDDEDKETKTD